MRAAASASAAARRAERAASSAVSSSESVRSTVAISDCRCAARRAASVRLSPRFREVLSERVALFGEDAQLPGRTLFFRARGRALRLGLGVRALGGAFRGERGVERRGERSDLLRERADLEIRRGQLRHDAFPLGGEVHEIAPDREEAFSRDLRAGGFDHRAPHDDAIPRHERALGMQRRERERVVHVRDDDGVGQRGGGRPGGLRR